MKVNKRKPLVSIDNSIYKPLVSIIIVQFGKKDKLNNCLKKINQSEIFVPYEVIVVDNNKDNVGYGAGNNKGARKATGKYLFIINPDAYPLPGAIDVLVSFLGVNKRVAIVAPNLLDKKRNVFSQIGSRELTPLRGIFALSFINKLFPYNPISRSYYLADISTDVLRSVDVVPGSGLMIRRDIFIKVGGFDENFFLYFEESDLCKRIKKLGYDIYINPKAEVIHDWTPGKPGTALSKKYFNQSRFYYFKKHYGIIWAIIVEAFARFGKKLIWQIFQRS